MKRSPSILPSILHAYPGLSQSMQPHSITDPPPSFTVPSTSLSLSPSPAFFQAHFLPSDPRQLILVSSDHTTLLQSPRVQSLCLIESPLLPMLLWQKGLFLPHHCLHTSSPEVSVHCLGSDRLVGDRLKCFWDLYYYFSLPRGNKVDCMIDVGWKEFDRTTTRRLGEVRAMLRMNFWDGTNADTSKGWYLHLSLISCQQQNHSNDTWGKK